MQEDNKKEIDLVRPYKNDVLSKSNYLIGAKYKASVLENQITYLAMLQIQEGEYEEKPDGVYVSMSAAKIKNEIKEYRKDNKDVSGSFYTNLKTVADAMTGNNMGIVDDENQTFEFVTLINKATYKDQVFTIRFANELKPNLINIRSDFTKIPESIVMQFRKPYSMPLYQVLKRQCYYPKDYRGRRDNVFLVQIGLAELKLDMGVVNSNLAEVKAVLNAGKGTRADYERAVAKSPEKKYNQYKEFKRACLVPTIEEINKVSDIYVEFEEKKEGSGRKVVDIAFTVYLEGAENNSNRDSVVPVTLSETGGIEKSLSDEEKFVLYTKILAVFESQLDIGEVITLCEAAKYDEEAIMHAKDVLNQQKAPVDNLIGWLITCIKENWTIRPYEPVKRAESSHNFDERKHDEAYFNNLEKQLLNN